MKKKSVAVFILLFAILIFNGCNSTLEKNDVSEIDVVRSFLHKVYEFIGDDCEIVVNSGIDAEIELDNYNESDFAIISEQLPNDIEKYQGAGIKARLMLYDIRNIKTGEINQCVFLYYVHSDEGVVMIESDFVDRERYNKILSLIKKA